MGSYCFSLTKQAVPYASLEYGFWSQIAQICLSCNYFPHWALVSSSPSLLLCGLNDTMHVKHVATQQANRKWQFSNSMDYWASAGMSEMGRGYAKAQKHWEVLFRPWKLWSSLWSSLPNKMSSSKSLNALGFFFSTFRDKDHAVSLALPESLWAEWTTSTTDRIPVKVSYKNENVYKISL